MTNSEISSYPSPISRTRKSNFPYKFKITKDYHFSETNWKLDHEFNSLWLKISMDGKITVKSNKGGYAWDGCTPKLSFLNLFIFGVPDGHIDYRTMRPYAYHASLVHDVLYQYLDSVPIKKRAIDELFLKMLGDFKLRHIYYLFVRLFGGRGIVQKNV